MIKWYEQQIGDKSSFTLRKSGTKNVHSTSEQHRDSEGVMQLKLMFDFFRCVKGMSNRFQALIIECNWISSFHTRFGNITTVIHIIKCVQQEKILFTNHFANETYLKNC